MASDGHDEISKERWDFSRRRFLRLAGGAVAGGTAYAGLTGALSAEGASAATLAHEAAFASHRKYHFVMVNHVTTNSFFTATITASRTRAPSRVLLPMDRLDRTRSSARWSRRWMPRSRRSANGIGVCLIDNTAFNSPVDNALSDGIPVIAYNADVAAGLYEQPHGLRRPVQPDRGSRRGETILKHGDRRATRSPGSSPPRAPGTSSPGSTAPSRSSRRPGVHFVEVGTSATEGSPEYDKIAVLVRRPQGREVHDGRRQWRQRRRRGVHPQQPPEGQGRASGLGCRLPVIDAITNGTVLPRSTSRPTCRASTRSCSSSSTTSPAG